MDTAGKHEIAALFYEIEEPFAAGLFEEPDRSYFYRYCLGYARYLEKLRPAPYEAGDLVYPRARRFWLPPSVARAGSSYSEASGCFSRSTSSRTSRFR